LLPSTTIDKVLEKANMDYESESQKECQDILDSIDDLIDFEGLKERALHPSDRNHSPITSSENMIPQVDGSGDELFSTPCAGSTGNSSGTEMRAELEGSSKCHTLQDVGGRFTSKHKRKQSVWGSLPFSTTKKVNNDLDPVGFHKIDSCVHETKAPEDTSCLAINEAGSYAAGFMKNADTDVRDLKESSTLVGCSMRDLMRRKRSYRVEPLDCGSHRDKRVLLEGEQRDGIILFPRQLNDELEVESLNLTQSLTGQQTDFHKACEANVTPLDCKPNNVDSAASMGHCEICNDKESDLGATTMTNERFPLKDAAASSCLRTGLIERKVSRAHCSIYESGHKDESSLARVHNKSYENLLGTNTTTDSMGLLNENCGGREQGRDFVFSRLGNSESIVVNTMVKCTKLIGLTFSKKPPIADWADGTSENASFPPTSDPEENYEGTSGCISGLLHGIQFLFSFSFFQLLFWLRTSSICAEFTLQFMI
jgi:DNA polymerase zeta